MSGIVVARNRQVDCFGKGATEWSEPFYFIQGADIQLGMIESYLEKKPNPGWEEEIELGNKAVARINAMKPKPKFFVMCGDLCHAFPEESKVRKKQEADFKKIFEKLDPEIPMICLSGNHDVGNTPTPQTTEMYTKTYGDDYFSFWCSGILFLVLNTQYFEDASKVPDLAKEHEDWLNGELEKAKQSGARVIVFQHIPWFVENPDEEANYFSIKPPLRKIWLEKLKNAGVEHVFAGHLHRNAGGVFQGMPVTVTTAIGAQLGTDQPGLRVVKVLKNEVQQKFYTLDNMPDTVTFRKPT
ncbi:serine/threonine-protein phosphatase CPPED1-like isoform X1 [Periplaneta americana]|uniref:serine/threonine-protein phosphatase CPPED1-like isoform X1 n=2 Tax=Periplaneta americana TaxID=6978 RepID=UPI0037E91FC3